MVEHNSRQFDILKQFANNIVFAITVIIFFYYVYYGLKLMVTKKPIKDNRMLLVCNAVVISQFLKNVFKVIFSRYWAATFVCKNPSLVSNHVYGFNWFKFGNNYASFPSGHSAFIFAFSLSMWFFFSKLPWLWALLALLVVIGQIGMYYHFVSDVLAGILLGLLSGLCAVKFQQKQYNTIKC